MLLWRTKTEKETPPSWRYAIPLVLAITVFVASSLVQDGRWLQARNDFPMLYLSGELQPLGKIYDSQAMYEHQERLLGAHAKALLFTRPAFYSLFFVPLAKLPYLWAYGIYLLLQITLISVWFKMTWANHPKLVLTAGLSLPLLLALGNGQDIPMAAALCGIAWHWLDRRPFAAGLVLSLCSIKLHLFLLVPFALIRFARWRTFVGGLTGGLVLFGLCFVADGPHWISHYQATLSSKGIHGDVNQAGNIRALTNAFGLPGLDAWLLGAGLLGCLWLIWRSRTVEVGLTYAIAGTLVFNWHSFLQDFTLLLTLVPWVSRMGLTGWGDRAWRLVLSPVPYVAAMPGAPFSAILPLSMLAFLKFSQEKQKLT